VLETLKSEKKGKRQGVRGKEPGAEARKAQKQTRIGQTRKRNSSNNGIRAPVLKPSSWEPKGRRAREKVGRGPGDNEDR